MVVRFDLECDGQTISDRDYSRILAWPLQHVRRTRGQGFQKRPRMLVRAMLAPQCTHNAQLGERRRAPEHGNQPLVLDPGESVLGDQRRCNDRIAGSGRNLRHQAATLLRMDSNSRTPSSEPSSELQARSGCGIMPSTLPASLTMPAMFRSEPLGLASALVLPIASAYLKITRPSPSRRSITSGAATKRPSP